MVKSKKKISCNLKKELKIGAKIELKEHGKLFPKNLRKYLSEGIAKDHIVKEKNPCYYTDKRYGLIAMEKKLKKEMRKLK